MLSDRLAATGLDTGLAGKARTGSTALAERRAESLVAPFYLTADRQLIRPETLDRLRELVATPAVTDCPVNISREEAAAIVEMVETRQAVAGTWSQTLDWGSRYAWIARRFAERAGFTGYANWLEKRRIEPMRQLSRELSARTAIASTNL